ncbi:MAG: type II toxin-antitoxin system RelE/ParE family toxin [Planctomycetota bacterium]|nr:type II toxin-antitoxin system RelE/ParE family toxin [Planctomycetota bacterium]
MDGPQLEFHPVAEAEAEPAVDWYVERSVQAAEGFLDELDVALQKVSDAPDLWARYLHGTRRYLLKRYPFIVVYRGKSADVVQIVAIAHGHRRPGYWRVRVED